MVNQDLTTYTEVDPNGVITVTSPKVAYANMSKLAAEVAYVYKDFGVNYFDGDFEHLLQSQLTSGDNNCYGYVWGMANAINTLRGIQMASGDFITVRHAIDAGGTPSLQIVACEAGAITASAVQAISLATIYYLTVRRDEAVGANGTLYCDIYTDSGRTSLLATISLVMPSKKDFRYLYVLSARNDNEADYKITGFQENFDLGGISINSNMFLVM